MPEFNGGSSPLMCSVWLLTAFLLPSTSALSQSVRTPNAERKMILIQQQLEAVEQRFTSVRIEIMKLRADADYIESAISEEMHLMQALKRDDETTSPPSREN